MLSLYNPPVLPTTTKVIKRTIKPYWWDGIGAQRVVAVVGNEGSGAKKAHDH